MLFNSLARGRFQFNFRKVIFQANLLNGGWSISYEIALRWMPQDLTDDKSALVKVMAWCRQATSHYLSQCWPRSMLPNGVTRPQWVNNLRSEQNGRHLAATFSNAFSWLKIILFWLKFQWSLLLSIQSTIWLSALVQVMAWCCQATSHYMNQYWSRSVMPYCITRLLWAK